MSPRLASAGARARHHRPILILWGGLMIIFVSGVRARILSVLFFQIALLASVNLCCVSRSAAWSYDGPAELPRIYITTSIVSTPAPGRVTIINAGGSLQNALNSASCGDTIELQAAATFY